MNPFRGEIDFLDLKNDIHECSMFELESNLTKYFSPFIKKMLLGTVISSFLVFLKLAFMYIDVFVFS